MSAQNSCPWCGAAQDPVEARRDVAAVMADELEEQGQAWQARSDVHGSQWFAEGIKFAAMWLRSL